MSSASQEESPTNAKTSRPNKIFLEIEIAIWSFTAVFFELICVRWLCCDIRPLVFEQSFPLVACLTGLASGLANRNDRPFILFPSALFLFVLAVKVAEMFGLANQRSAAEGSFDWQILSPGNEGLLTFVVFQFLGLITLMLFPFFVSFCTGCRLGILFEQVNSIKGYSLNAVASLLGCLAAYGIGFLAPNPVWSIAFIAATSIYICIAKDFSLKKRVLALIPLALLPMLAIWQIEYPKLGFPPYLTNYCSSKTQTLWSSYQRIDLDKLLENPQLPESQTREIGMVVRLNKVVDQVFFDPNISIDDLPPTLTKIFADRRRLDANGFLFGKAENVLILGSGLGQEIPGAIKNGARSIDVVEIDPALMKISRQINTQVSKNANVNFICDDARHFIETSKKQYDLVLMSNLYAQSSNILAPKLRLDTYCYTREAFKSALSRLSPNGKLVIAYPVVYPWIGERIFRTLEFAAGRTPQVFQQSYHMASHVPTLFVVPSKENEKSATPQYWSEIGVHPKSNTPILTDNWPFLYVLQSTLDLPMRLSFVALLVMGFVGARHLVFDTSVKKTLNFVSFALGAGFTIIELQSIDLIARFFGNTWLSSSFVVAASILTVLLANVFVTKGSSFVLSNSKSIFLAIAIFLISNFIWSSADLARVFGSSAALVCGLLQFMPAFLGSSFFAAQIKENNNLSQALAASTFGCLLAAILQFVKLSFGIKTLSLIALAFYVAAFLTSQREVEKKSDI